MRKFPMVAAATVSSLLAVGGAAGAQTSASSVESFRANLAPVPHNPAADRGSNASGTAYVIRQGDRITAAYFTGGLSAGLPHAVHIHGFEQAVAECPALSRDTNADGLIDTAEGLPDYGGILVSLTTSGGTSGGLLPDGLDLSRFPVANSAGYITYNRTFNIPSGIAATLGNHHIVVHGHDLNGNGTYDGPASSLSAMVGQTVPLEAELPVACGKLIRR